MSVSWEKAQKRLRDLEKRRIPEPITIELLYHDNSKEILSLEEILERDNSNWKLFSVKGTKKKELREFLEWLAPECVIK